MQEGDVNYTVASSIEQDILHYINNSDSENYSEVLKSDERWEVFYHLSPTRTAIIDWYDFKYDAEILEVGGGFGAITGRLCDKVRGVTVVEKAEYRAKAIAQRYSTRKNICVITGDVLKLTYDKKFDYIVVNGVLGTSGCGTDDISAYADFLKKLSLLLKEQGKILFTIENRLGIKYFCGVKEKYSNTAFMGINRYPEKTNGRTFSKFEVERILKEAKIEKYKFYYPMPDHITTQVVYSDNYLPGNNINERIMTYYPQEESLLIVENIVYSDLVENKVFTFMANSFFVECSFNCEQGGIDFATVTADRGAVHGQVTAIYSNEIVKKHAICKQGNYITKLCYDNIQEIAARGVHVVPHEYADSIISMPYINEKPLSEKIGELASGKPEDFIAIFDLLNDNILRSSEHVDQGLNMLHSTISRPDIGVILEKAYIDMVPFNCFYINGKCIFFDQEFVREYYPAKYVLFRALMYTYLHNPFIENIVSLGELKKRYGLDKLWNLFLKEEKKFISENRSREMYPQLYKWADVKRKEIFKRDKNLMDLRIKDNSYAEIKGIKLNLSYEAFGKLKEIQKVQKKLLKKTIEICEENELNYFAYYGTLLGAVRHNDIIPWDDDVDIVMPREDYEKFISIMNEMRNQDIYLQTIESDKDCFYGGYAKLRDNNTTAIELRNWESNCCQGIWIDIMPLDRVFSNRVLYKIHINTIMLLQKLMYAKVYGEKKHAFEYIPGLMKIWKGYFWIAKCFRHKSLCTFLNKTICVANKVLKSEKAYKVGVLARYMRKVNRYQVMDKSVFDTYKIEKFGDLLIRIPDDEVTCLRKTEGRNYLNLPEIELRKPHHVCFFNVNTSWKIYLNRFKNIFQDAKNKKIIIVGSGIWFESYMKSFGKEYVPYLLVETNEKYWDAKKFQYKIERPDEILKIDSKDRHIIICDKMFHKCEEKLQTLGISNYYIYVYELKWLLRN